MEYTTKHILKSLNRKRESQGYAHLPTSAIGYRLGLSYNWFCKPINLSTGF